MPSPSPEPTRDPEVPAADGSLRLRMKPSTDSMKHAGYVDGAWWPHTRDLARELPTLFAGLSGRLGTIERMAYRITEWKPAARRITSDGHTVRLGGFNHQGADTIDVSSTSGIRVTLLVIPPDTESADAQHITETAATTGNLDPVAALLVPAGTRSTKDGRKVTAGRRDVRMPSQRQR